MDVQGAEIAFSPGFRWGTTLLPGETITRELMMDQLAITYPYATVTEMTGETIKTVLEDVADNLFNPDPYYQQGGDMVRVGGLQYTCDARREDGQPHRRHAPERQADRRRRTYKVAGWAPVAEEARARRQQAGVGTGRAWLKARGGKVPARKPKLPRLTGGRRIQATTPDQGDDDGPSPLAHPGASDWRASPAAALRSRSSPRPSPCAP